MLFQTLVQLNILILATPALAGWSLLPPAHGVTVHAVSIVWHRAGSVPAAIATAETQPAKRMGVLPAVSVLATAIAAKFSDTAVDSPPILTYAARAA